MGAIGDRALAPMFLHPLQYGGRNLRKAYTRDQGLTLPKACIDIGQSERTAGVC